MKYHRWSFYFALLTILAATAGPAVYLGQRQELQAEAIEQAAARLGTIPSHFGPWNLREEEPLPDSTLRMLQCESHVSRTYMHSQTGELVSLVVLVGPAGPLVAHTPDICMASREWELLKAATPVSLSASTTDRFYSTLLRAKTLEGDKLNVYYAWSRDGKSWEAPESPRVALGPLPVLYKIQVASPDSSRNVESSGSAVKDFLSDLLPRLAEDAGKSEIAKGS
ncbi:MAG: exosortase-associated EpsI family protein [Pirellulales bacterium]